MNKLVFSSFLFKGSTHDVTVTEDFDDGFGELIADRHGQVTSITNEKPESFKYDEIKRHTAVVEDKIVEDNDQPLIQF